MKLYLVLIFVFSSSFVLGQAHLFEGKSNGYSYEGFYSKGNYGTVVGVGVGFILKGRLSLNLSIPRQVNLPENLKIVSILPSASFLILKQGRKNHPINLGTSIAYRFSSFAGVYNYNGLTGKLTSETVHLGAFIYHQFNISEEIKIIPNIRASKSTGFYRIDNNAIGEIYSYNGYGFGITGAFRNYFVKPAVSFTELNEPSFSLSIGGIIQTTNN